MSDPAKPYDATPSRRERAKREGNVARSAELCAIASFGGAVVAAAGALHVGGGAAVAAVVASARLHGDDIGAPLGTLSLAALAPAALAAMSGSAAALTQAGGLHVRGLKLDLARLDPVAGFKRIAGGEAVVGVVRASVAFVAAIVAAFPPARDAIGGAIASGSPSAATAVVISVAFHACAAAFVVGSVFAFADYALARRRWLAGLKMSHDELKRDAKENDGDQQARSRRSALHRSLMRGAVGRTRDASFVVVNPTHVAVAIRYAPPAVPVPQMLVRACDEAAQRVRSIARTHGIPIIEDVALARLLYAYGESGRAIPAAAYVAVAQVIASLAREGVLA